MFQLLLLVCLWGASFGASIPERGEIEGYTMGGRDTNISEVPYQVGLLKGSLFICGGSIVAPKMIVTAAHCVAKLGPKEITVRAGSSDSKRGGVLIQSENIWIHPKYDDFTFDYDVALVKLQEPLKYSNTTKSIKLIKSRPRNGSLATVSGWGTIWTFHPISETLQSVKVPIVDRENCTKLLSKYTKITPRMICAGAEGKDACPGDRGGPLNYKGRLAGIVSFGIGCGRKNSPGVYADVFNPEINSFIRKYAKI